MRKASPTAHGVASPTLRGGRARALLRLILRNLAERLDLQQPPLVYVCLELDLLRLPLALHAYGEGLRVASPLDAHGQEAPHVGASVRGVMLLPVLVVAEHVDPIEVRRVNGVDVFADRALLKNDPASRSRVLRRVLVLRSLLRARGVVAVESLPCNELAPGSIEDYVAR